jgi:pyruvate dehydrogenase E2 component (dihydrolipoamide acetyltransferase)
LKSRPELKDQTSMASEIKLEPLKEGVDSVEVNAVKVAVGDVVAKDQTLMEVQADKAALDVGSPVAGKVTKILVKTGDQIKVGQAYVVIESTNGDAPAKPAQAKSTAQSKSKEAADGNSTQATAKKNAQPTTEPAPPVAEPVKKQDSAARLTIPVAQPVGGDRIVPAGPATRQLARELGVDLRQVSGTGRHGRIIQEDIRTFVRQLAAGALAPTAGGASAPPALPKFEEWGPVERQQLSAIRKATARQMSVAWTQIPHVTQHDLADVTDLEAFRKQQDGRGPKLTVTAFALKAVAIALREFPTFNSSLDLAANQLVLKQYYHVGVAVDTPNGLLVPVLRDVNRKSVSQLAEELIATADRAKQRKLDGNELKGGTFTITNLGGIGGTGFTPIVNFPEVAILGLSRSRLEPVVHSGQIVPRLMLPLSLSYDHRVIDGAAAARFTRRIAELLENPLVMLVHA